MGEVSAIVTSRRDPQRATVRVDGKAAATLSRKLIDELGIIVGCQWTQELADRVQQAVAADKAMRAGLSRLNRRAMSTRRLKQKLKQSGHDGPAIEQAVGRLSKLRALDDHAFGRALVQELVRRKSAGQRLIRAKLMQRGLDAELIDELLAEEINPQQQQDAAKQLLTSRLKNMQHLNANQRKQRLWSMLLRKGFDSDVVSTAIEQALGADDYQM